MIALLFSWILMAAIFYTFGRAFMQLWTLITKSKSQPSPLDVILVGMCVTASVIAIASLWVPSNTMFLFALGFICILYWFCNLKSIPKEANTLLDFIGEQPKLHLVMYGVLIISVGMFCTLHPIMTDTLYYHYQNLMWNEQYAVIPGLGNLQPRFAFNSSFFLLGSVFGLKPLFGQFIFGVHSFFLVAIYVWVMYKTLHSKNILRSLIAIIMITCLFVIYKVHITSVTTDFLPNLLILYLVMKVVFDRDAIRKSSALYFLLSTFIITLKLSCFAIVALPLYVMWLQIKDKQYKSLILSVAAGLFIVVPWCIRTVILSGYIIFPLPLFDVFTFDWKIPMEYLIEQKEFIQSFARIPNDIEIDKVLNMPISEWLPMWWQSDMQYYNPIANRLFSILTLVSFPVGFFLLMKRKKEDAPLFIIWGACVVGIVVWFFNAPDFRFIYSLILSHFFVVLILCLERVEVLKNIGDRLKQFNFAVVLTIITIIFVSLYSGRWVYHKKGEPNSFADLVRVPTSIKYTRKLKEREIFHPFEVNGMVVFRSSGSDRDVMCFDCELPCSADYVGGLEMRGETLQEGFRCKPNAPHRLTY